jgi:hypothetical protein
VSKRKKGSRDERRREHVEVNLMTDGTERRPLARARRGCSLPFLGGGMFLLGLEVIRTGLG